MSNIFERRESQVMSYARSFPTTFDRAEGAWMIDTEGHRYLDFLAGCGTLNYGHNPQRMTEALVDYMKQSGVAHGMDMHTRAKEEFLEAFDRIILEPRELDYVAQFTGPTGANAVEAALKIARKATGRQNIVTFTNGFHGVSLGALSVTGNQHHRGGAGVPLGNADVMPYDGYLGDGVDTTAYFDKLLSDPSSGIDKPAAAIVECVQGEGGLTAASFDWLKNLEAVCRKHDILLIVDDIQAGCGRTGTFFSFEPAGIKPDIVTLAKSISGYGLPMALTLIRRDLDLWKPGEHNGTFRGNNHAFITAKVALEEYWDYEGFGAHVLRKGEIVRERFEALAEKYKQYGITLRGRGLMQGLAFADGAHAEAVTKACFESGLIIETSGGNDEVVKVLCPLTISDQDLEQGLDILSGAMDAALDAVIPAAAE